MQSQLQLPVPRQSSRAKKSKQKARVGHEQAHVELRWREVEFLPGCKRADKKALALRVVQVLVPLPPLGAQPVEWFLLTTCEITTTQQAQECVRWYCLRWRIKTGTAY